MKPRALLLVPMALVFLALLFYWLFTSSAPMPAVEVQGNLTQPEVVEIRRAIWHKLHPPILPNLSFQSLREAPERLIGRFRPAPARVYTIEARTPNFVAVLGRPTTTNTGVTCFFWGVFREKNGWVVYNEYHLNR